MYCSLFRPESIILHQSLWEEATLFWYHQSLRPCAFRAPAPPLVGLSMAHRLRVLCGLLLFTILFGSLCSRCCAATQLRLCRCAINADGKDCDLCFFSRRFVGALQRLGSDGLLRRRCPPRTGLHHRLRPSRLQVLGRYEKQRVDVGLFRS